MKLQAAFFEFNKRYKLLYPIRTKNCHRRTAAQIFRTPYCLLVKLFMYATVEIKELTDFY